MKQNTNTILLVEPVAFGYNAQTAKNNFFQHEDEREASEIQELALKEFRAMVKALHDVGIKTIVVKDTVEPHTPDAIFPNNWVSFHSGGEVVIYPMYAPNRRNERRLDIVNQAIGGNNRKIISLIAFEDSNKYLEGTGSLILDRKHHIAYASISERTDATVVAEFCSRLNYQSVLFHSFQTFSGKRCPIYHSNVMMSVADHYVVICMASIENVSERLQLIVSFEKTGKEIIDISEAQMHAFAGNVLQVQNAVGQKILILSQTAYQSLSKSQIDKLTKYNKLLPIAVPTIEHYGGGSVRCMMAEIF
ncbi:MAG: amidinotransferase [Porphyromonadaceae bacterium CG2_30_38_12]|nr:MAG: amidinotransferase [Porphyromonadaceae bacterium CG2_30_38_12]